MNNLKIRVPNEKEPLHSWLPGRRRVQPFGFAQDKESEIRGQGADYYTLRL